MKYIWLVSKLFVKTITRWHANLRLVLTCVFIKQGKIIIEKENQRNKVDIKLILTLSFQ